MKIQLSDNGFNESVFGVQFHNGIGDLSDNQIQKLRAFGRWDFTILKEQCEKCPKLLVENTNLKLEVEELKAKLKVKK